MNQTKLISDILGKLLHAYVFDCSYRLHRADETHWTINMLTFAIPVGERLLWEAIDIRHLL